MATILNSVIRYQARKLAHAHIRRALAEMKCGRDFSVRQYQGEIRRNFWARKSIDFVFSHAYDEPWNWLGSEDAQRGWKRFDLPAYLKGWRGRVLAVAYDGWVNPRMIQQFGWVDETIAQQCLNSKCLLDELDWAAAPLKP